MTDDKVTTVAIGREGDWSQTYTGRQFWPCDPRPDDVCIEDIAHALALQCRFAGHCRVPYSVAEHSVRVSLVVERLADDGCCGERLRRAVLAALLHDASEAYCVDVPRPLKPYLRGYKDIEARVMRAIESWADLPSGACDGPMVKRADEVLLMTEARDIMSAPPVAWTFAQGAAAQPLDEVIVPWDWRRAEAEFLARFAAFASPEMRTEAAK